LSFPTDPASARKESSIRDPSGGLQAGLILSGVLPNQQDLALESLEDMYYQGRLTEVCMVYYVGAMSSAGQPEPEVAARDPELGHLYLQPAVSSACSWIAPAIRQAEIGDLGRRRLPDHLPPQLWARCHLLGSSSPEQITPSFLQHYAWYADQLFEARMRQEQPPVLPEIHWSSSFSPPVNM